MKILVEDYAYSSPAVAGILADFEPKSGKNGVSSSYVGYCFSKNLKDCCFFLPKVILNKENKVFGELCPEDIVEPAQSNLNDDQKSFLSSLGIWTYRALAEYRDSNPDTVILHEKQFSETSGTEEVSGTYLDIILSLVKFYQDNRDFVVYTLRNIHSHQHRINWQKTISRTQAIIQDDEPVYVDPISKKKVINYDEELLVIFFSILNYLKKYGFHITLDINVNLITGELFNSYLDGLGTVRLRRIKYKYFSDKMRQLWSLCYSFFRKEEEIRSSRNESEFLMATNFNIVFEAMVDELLGNKDYDDWKKLGDGKVLDHIYKYKSVCSREETFYIGDSKYYKVAQGVKEKSESTMKQFSYARSIVNASIRESLQDTWPYRDALTEGYAVIPNFFIGSETDPQLRWDVDGLDRDDIVGEPFHSMQFVNRLFDRDTLWVRQYNINFLYVLSSYASADDYIKGRFKEKAHRLFRQRTIDLLNRHYDFYILTPKDGKTLEEVMKGSVKWDLRGMVYRYSQTEDKLILAFEKPDYHNDDDNTKFSNSIIAEDRIMYEARVKPLFDEKPVVLSKDPENPFEFIDGCPTI